jgi:hypothetical protein
MPMNDALNDDVSLTGLSPNECSWAIRSFEDSPFGRCVPRTMRPPPGGEQLVEEGYTAHIGPCSLTFPSKYV